MITVFVLELSAGISGYVLRNEAGQMLRNNLQKTMAQYKELKYISALWDEVQRDVRISNLNLRARILFHSIYSSNVVA